MDKTFDPQILAFGLAEVNRMYARFFAGLNETSWDKPVKGGPSVFCQMLTGRFNLPIGLISGRMKLCGDLRLFLRMKPLFSVDARPKGETPVKTALAPNR